MDDGTIKHYSNQGLSNALHLILEYPEENLLKFLLEAGVSAN